MGRDDAQQFIVTATVTLVMGTDGFYNTDYTVDHMVTQATDRLISGLKGDTARFDGKYVNDSLKVTAAAATVDKIVAI